MNFGKSMIHHSRGKSDTNFYQERNVLNGANSSIIYLRGSLFKDIETKVPSNLNKTKKKICDRKYSQDSMLINASRRSINKSVVNSFIDSYNLNLDSTDDNDILLSLLEKILLFKKEVDLYFFNDKLRYLKFHLNNIAAIIMKNIENLQNQLITECPQIKEDNNDIIIQLLDNFSDILKLFVETKPQEFYREVKDAIINQWEKNNQRIIEFFNSLEENSVDNEDSNFCSKTVIDYLLENQRKIKNFIYKMSQGTLFAISQLFYKMDYYSLIISSMVFKMFYGIMAYIDYNKIKKNENMSSFEISRQNKVLHIVCHIISLAGIFSKNNQDFNNIDNGGLNSMSKYILNNLNELIPKCKGIKDPEKEVVIKNSLFKKIYKTKFYKSYLQRYKKYTDNQLLKLFDLFYNSKFIFWKSTIFELDDKKQTYFCCRICEKKIPLNEIFLHMYYCNEQKQFYEKINQIKTRFKNCFNLLESYINELIKELNTDKNINNTDNKTKRLSTNAKKGGSFSEVVKFLPKNDKNDENEVISFLKNLIRIFSFENDKPLNYYEEEPQKLTHIIYMSYLCIFLYITNKSYQFSEIELNEIFGGFFNCSLQIMMNVLFLLYIQKTKTKSNFMNLISSGIQENSIDKIAQKLPIKQFDIDNDLTSTGKSNSYESSEKSKSNPKNLNQLINDFKLKLSLNNVINMSNTDKVNSIYNNSNYYNMSTKSNTNISSFYNNYNGETYNRMTGSLKLRKNTNNSVISNNSSYSNKSQKNRKSRSKTVIIINTDDKIVNFKEKDDNLQYIFNSNIKATRKNYNNEINDNDINFGNEILNYTSYNNKLDNLINDQEKEKTDGCSIILNESSNTLLMTESEYGDEMGSFFDDTELNGNSLISNGLRNHKSKRFNFKKRNTTTHEKSYRLKRNSSSNKMSLFTSNNYQNFENDGDNILIGFEEEEDEDDDDLNEIISDKNDSNSNNNDSLENYAKEFSELNFNLDPEMIKFLFDKKFYVVFEELLKNSINASEKDADNEENKNKIMTFRKRIKSSKNFDNYTMLDDVIDNNKVKNINDRLLRKKNKDTNNTISEKENEDSFSISSSRKDYNIRSSGSNKRAQKLANNILEKEKNKQINDSEKMSGFKFIFPIAKGGYGSVALYQKIATGDYYAIKAVDINCMKERKLSSTLKKEHDILSEMNSDYVVKSYFIFPGEKYYYYVMEYLPGGDVGGLLSKIVLKTSTIQLITAEMLLGILYLHQVGIIHHDIKPENILISKEGHFKLSDFGLSTILDKSSKKNVRKLQDFVDFNENSSSEDFEEDDDDDDRALGTLDYMAPELFTDEYPVGGEIDYWAVGVVIFELFTNKVPFQGQTQDETKNNIIEMKIDWEPLLNDEIKSNYKDIDIAIDLINKFLVRDPSQRWGDENFNEIKQHPFFKNFNWNKIKQIRDPQVMFCIKKLVQANNEKIKKLNMKKKLEKNGSSEDKNINDDKNENNNGDFPLLIDINLNENEEKVKFTERLDNLNKKNNELIQRKFIKKEFNIKDNKNRLSLLLDLE